MDVETANLAAVDGRKRGSENLASGQESAAGPATIKRTASGSRERSPVMAKAGRGDRTFDAMRRSRNRVRSTSPYGHAPSPRAHTILSC